MPSVQILCGKQISCPSRSPDLSKLDTVFVGCVKHKVYSSQEIKGRLSEGTAAVTHDTVERAWPQLICGVVQMELIPK